MENYNPCSGLVERLFWLVRLRWVAIAGVLIVLLFCGLSLSFSLPFPQLYTLVGFLAASNIAYIILLNRFSSVCKILGSAQEGAGPFGIINPEPFGFAQGGEPVEPQTPGFSPGCVEWIDGERSRTINWIANIQISADLIILIGLIHFSGGIENPFIFYSIFHMIIASILLSRRESFLQATFVAALFGIMTAAEYFGVLPHHRLEGLFVVQQYKNIAYIGGISFVFITTLYIAVYMATSISCRLRQREKSLRQANALLNEKDRLKNEYVVRVSHDIKEDLAAIQSCLEPVQGGVTGELNPKQLDLISRAVQRTAKLLFFVKELLEITRIRLSKEIKMDYFSFREIVFEAVNQISPKAKAKNITISWFVEEGIDKIRGSKEYLQETITNLLANSVKYTPKEGVVNVNAIDKGNSILTQIQDTGIGIPKEELPKIFEEFYRATNAKEVERDGTGLGLSIAKQVIERHNGKIWVESQEGHGSIFYILLPK